MFQEFLECSLTTFALKTPDCALKSSYRVTYYLVLLKKDNHSPSKASPNLFLQDVKLTAQIEDFSHPYSA